MLSIMVDQTAQPAVSIDFVQTVPFDWCWKPAGTSHYWGERPSIFVVKNCVANTILRRTKTDAADAGCTDPCRPIKARTLYRLPSASGVPGFVNNGRHVLLAFCETRALLAEFASQS